MTTINASSPVPHKTPPRSNFHSTPSRIKTAFEYPRRQTRTSRKLDLDLPRHQLRPRLDAYSSRFLHSSSLYFPFSRYRSNLQTLRSYRWTTQLPLKNALLTTRKNSNSSPCSYSPSWSPSVRTITISSSQTYPRNTQPACLRTISPPRTR